RIFHVGDSGRLTLSGVVIDGGLLEDGSSGAGMLVTGEVTMTTVRFEGNSAWDANGGAFAEVDAVADLVNVDFVENVVGPDAGGFTGAAIYLESSELDHDGGVLTGNRGSFDGGSAVAHVDAGSNAVFNVDFEDNEAAAVWNLGTLTLFGANIVNSANEQEAGLVNEGTAFLEKFTVTGNNAQATGGIYNTGSLDMFDGTVIENSQLDATVTHTAGGVANVGGSVHMNEVQVRLNSALGTQSGGG